MPLIPRVSAWSQDKPFFRLINPIQVLLGHKKLETTALYAQVGTDILREVVSPIETLPPH
jgi:hypothetical protein